MRALESRLQEVYLECEKNLSLTSPIHRCDKLYGDTALFRVGDILFGRISRPYCSSPIGDSK